MSHQLTKSEKLSYSFAGLGQNMIYSMQLFFLMYFYNYVFKVDAKIVGTIFLVARIWDASNDFIMGTIVENTKTRWGKLRPYLLFSPIPIGILTILTFSAPNLTESLKIVYVAITYILWGMIYTVCDVPYWGLTAAMTEDTKERTQLISLARSFTMIGMGIPIFLVPLILNITKTEKQGYLISAIIISVIGCSLLSLAFFKTKEHVKREVQKTSMTEYMGLLFKNIPLMLILLASLLGFSRNMAQSAGVYVANHIYFNEDYFIYLGGALMIGVITSIVITPFITRFISKKKLFIYSSIIGAVLYMVFYFIGYDHFSLVLLFLFLTSFSMGFYTVLQTAMIADSVDYLEWKTGKRKEALCFSGQTFFSKFSAGLTAFTMGIVLDSVHFIEEGPLNQGKVVSDGIFQLVTIYPAIGCILSIIPILFYRFTEDIQRKCVQEIKHQLE